MGAILRADKIEDIEVLSYVKGKNESRFRCNNSGEYVSNEMQKYFENKGIQFDFTLRFTQEQNGEAKRMNRTIIKKARCMLLGYNLEKVFWSEAVSTAIYLINRGAKDAPKGNLPVML